MDREGASYANTALDVERRFGAKTLLLQHPRTYAHSRASFFISAHARVHGWPRVYDMYSHTSRRAVGESSEFRGVVDLIAMETVS
jgi:hypothetical protein